MKNSTKEEERREEFKKFINFDVYYIGKPKKITVGLDEMIDWWLQKLDQRTESLINEIPDNLYKIPYRPKKGRGSKGAGTKLKELKWQLTAKYLGKIKE